MGCGPVRSQSTEISHYARFTGGPDRSPGPISPGKPAVCYLDNRLLGGGWIEG
jgi:hypothetical protein